MKSLTPRSLLPTAKELRLCWGGRFDAATDAHEHCHAETELVLVTAGRCRIEVAGLSLEGGADTLFVLPAGAAQYQTTLEPTRTTFIGFRVLAGLFDESARTLTLAADEPARVWLEQLCDSQLARPALGAEVTRRLLEALLRRLDEIDAAFGRRGRMHPALAEAIARIEQDLACSWSLGKIATAAGLSESHLGALFAAHCGCGPLQYLQQRRLQRACWLLDNPYLRIHEVAAACGYDDVNYFVRLFRRRFGQPPGRWRAARLTPPRAS